MSADIAYIGRHARGLDWQHFNGDGITAGAQEIYDPGHPVEVTWRLPGEDRATA